MEITRTCKACGKQHPLNYFLFSNGARHLFYKCTQTHQTFYVPRIDGLEIPVVKSRKLARESETTIPEPDLFSR